MIPPPYDCSRVMPIVYAFASAEDVRVMGVAQDAQHALGRYWIEDARGRRLGYCVTRSVSHGRIEGVWESLEGARRWLEELGGGGE